MPAPTCSSIFEPSVLHDAYHVVLSLVYFTEYISGCDVDCEVLIDAEYWRGLGIGLISYSFVSMWLVSRTGGFPGGRCCQ